MSESINNKRFPLKGPGDDAFRENGRRAAELLLEEGEIEDKPLSRRHREEEVLDPHHVLRIAEPGRDRVRDGVDGHFFKRPTDHDVVELDAEGGGMGVLVFRSISDEFRMEAVPIAVRSEEIDHGLIAKGGTVNPDSRFLFGLEHLDQDAVEDGVSQREDPRGVRLAACS